MNPVNRKKIFVLMIFLSIFFIFIVVQVYIRSPLFFSDSPKNVDPVFEGLMSEASGYIAKNQPQKALDIYQMALKTAGNDANRSIRAKLGMAAMQLWLENYAASTPLYDEIYKQALSARDRDAALEGLIRSLNYAGKPKEALALIPPDFIYKTPSMVIAVSEAYLNAENVDEAKKLLESQTELLQKISEKSRFIKELGRLNQQIKVAINNSEAAAKNKRLALKRKKFLQYLDKAERALKQGDYKKAQVYYTWAIKASKFPDDTNSALFGLGETYLFDNENAKALNVYKELLDKKLKKEDYEVALNGYVSALNNLDKPMKAYDSIPKHFHYTNPTLIVSAAQASLWAGWSYKARYILRTYEKRLRQIPPNSHLGREYEAVLWETNTETAPNTIEYKRYYMVDSDKFHTFKNTLNYSHRTSSLFNTSVSLTRSHFSLPGYGKINGNQMALQEEGALNDYWRYLANMSRAEYPSWKPGLWNFKLASQPNDVIKIETSTHKEVVEAISAINHHITVQGAELNINLQPIYRTFIAGGIFNSRFSDHYHRNGSSLNLRYLLNTDLGLYLDYFTRVYKAKNPSSFYFSPLKYRQKQLLLTIKRDITHLWYGYATGGIGRQWINTDPYTRTHKVQFGITGPLFKCINIDGYYLYNTSAGNVSGGYAYKVLGLNLQFIL